MTPNEYTFRYRVRNWPDYNRALIARGRLTLWFDEDAVAAWRNTDPPKGPGAPKVYSDTAIQCVLVLKSVFQLSLRVDAGLRSFTPPPKCPAALSRAVYLSSKFPYPTSVLPLVPVGHERNRSYLPSCPKQRPRRSKRNKFVHPFCVEAKQCRKTQSPLLSSPQTLSEQVG